MVDYDAFSKTHLTIHAKVMDGMEVAALVNAETAEGMKKLRSDGISPVLAVVYAGSGYGSVPYLNAIKKACAKMGIGIEECTFSEKTPEKEIISKVTELNNNPLVNGILVLFPLPEAVNGLSVTQAVSPSKDMDCITPHNRGLFVLGKERFAPCAPAAIMRMLDYYGISLEGRDVVIINRSDIVGKPLFQLMVARGATVTLCHSKTKNLKQHCLEAEIIVTAVGDRSKFVLTENMVREGAVVIDAGMDADLDEIGRSASYVAPGVGGIGPVTVAMLMKNVVAASSV